MRTWQDFKNSGGNGCVRLVFERKEIDRNKADGYSKEAATLQRVISSNGVRASLARCALWLSAVLAFCPSSSADENESEEIGPTAPVCVRALQGSEIRPTDEVWVIDCRGISVMAPEVTVARLRYERYLPGEGWLKKQAGEFLEQPADMVTTFFIVGNYYTPQETVEAGWFAYHRLVELCADDVRVRFVIWSWPSDPVPGRRLQDAKMKMRLIDPTAYHLAALVDTLSPTTPISMCGSSFGVGVALGAAQFLAVGRLDCYELSPRSGAQRCLRLVFLGAAVDDEVFLPGRKYDAVLPYIDRALLMVNPGDRALKLYHMLYGFHSGAKALGRVGPTGVAALPDAWKLDLVPAGRYLGHQHGMSAHWRSQPIVARMRPYLLSQPLQPARQAIGLYPNVR